MVVVMQYIHFITKPDKTEIIHKQNKSKSKSTTNLISEKLCLSYTCHR